MKSVACYHCGSNRHSFYAAENGFTLVRCDGCGLLYVTPRPDEREIAAGHELGVHQGEQKLEVTGRFAEVKVGRYLNILRDFFGDELREKSVSWLDIGCGHGEFLVALREFSGGKIVAKGVEPNLAKQESARSRGLDVGYYDLRTEARRYDFVSALNVYGHLPDPPATLSDWRRLLNPEGELLLETGDTAELPANKHPKPFYLPDHLSFASRRIVADLLRRIGFDVLDSRVYYWVKPGPVTVTKETVKLFWPGKKSSLRYMFRPTDLYIRARRKD